MERRARPTYFERTMTGCRTPSRASCYKAPTEFIVSHPPSFAFSHHDPDFIMLSTHTRSAPGRAPVSRIPTLSHIPAPTKPTSQPLRREGSRLPRPVSSTAKTETTTASTTATTKPLKRQFAFYGSSALPTDGTKDSAQKAVIRKDPIPASSEIIEPIDTKFATTAPLNIPKRSKKKKGVQFTRDRSSISNMRRKSPRKQIRPILKCVFSTAAIKCNITNLNSPIRRKTGIFSAASWAPGEFSSTNNYESSSNEALKKLLFKSPEARMRRFSTLHWLRVDRWVDQDSLKDRAKYVVCNGCGHRLHLGLETDLEYKMGKWKAHKKACWAVKGVEKDEQLAMALK